LQKEIPDMPNEEFKLTVTVPQGTVAKIVTEADKAAIAAAVQKPLAIHFTTHNLVGNASDVKVDCCDKGKGK
jgi:hypothetical protein